MRKTALDKLAALKTELLPHQQRVIDRLREQEGLLVAHGLGTGKTLASIGASDSLGGRTEALVPASLQENYLKEIAKHTTGAPNTSVRSMQGEALRGEQRPTDLLVVDEAHRARETSTKLYDILKDYPAAKRMLLSATPVYNRPSDIAPLVNIAAGRKVLPTGSAFKDRYVGKTSPGFLARMIYGETPEPILKNKKELGKILNKWVDYEPPSEKDFPKRINENIDVKMTSQQTDIHDMALGNLPWTQQRRINKGLPLEKKYLKDLNAFQSQTRQIGGSSKRFAIEKAELTPKLKRALEDLKSKLESNDQHRAVVYSNYLDVLGDYGEALKSEGVPSATYSGKLPQKQRKAMVDDYNAGKLKALLVSSAGGEGLDLKGTRQLQVLEPHWNDAKLEQVIGRAIRRGSHSHLPEDQRTVAVQRYLSRPRPGFVDRVLGNKPAGIEQVLSDMSLNKNQLNDQVMQLLKQPPLELEMQKTAGQIADTVLEKLSTSRWREAIRSGEVSGDKAELLKQRMGVDPVRELEGLNRGSKNILARNNFGLVEAGTLGDSVKRIRGNLGRIPLRENLKQEFQNRVFPTLGGGAVTLSHGTANPRVIMDANRMHTTLGQFAPLHWRDQDALEALVLRHEADEARMGKKFKTPAAAQKGGYGVANPNIEPGKLGPESPLGKTLNNNAKLNRLRLLIQHKGSDNFSRSAMTDATNDALAMTKGLQTGNHNSPKVLLNEARNQRMLPPSVQELMSNVRDFTGERHHMDRAQYREGLGLPTRRAGRIPRDKIDRMSKSMSQIASDEMGVMRRKVQDNIAQPLKAETAVRGLVNKVKGSTPETLRNVFRTAKKFF